MQSYKRVCEQAARAGGQVLLDWFGKIQPHEKAPKDLVTEADVASQEVVQQVIEAAYPDHEFLGEESSDSLAAGSRIAESGCPPRWIVDPLDGTTNYVHRFPGFSVSVALEQEGQVIVGTVFDPISGECFTAATGEGAYLNGERLRVSRCEKLREALVAASFSTSVHPGSPEISRFLAMLVECQAMRRLGSAALNLAYLATGRLDAYWATSVKVWDVAAGVLLLQEAGGSISNLDGGPFELHNPVFAASGSPQLQQQVLRCLATGEDETS